MLHRVGVESFAQIAVLVASTSVAGPVFGLWLLAAWVLGLSMANAAQAKGSLRTHTTLTIAVAVMSISVGALHLLGIGIFPATT
jgi:hypothetical protein